MMVLELRPLQQFCKALVFKNYFTEENNIEISLEGKFSKARKQIALPTISDVKEDPDQDGKGAIKYSSLGTVKQN